MTCQDPQENMSQPFSCWATLFSRGETQTRQEIGRASRATGVLTWPSFISQGEATLEASPFHHQLFISFVPVSPSYPNCGKNKVHLCKALDEGNKEFSVLCFSRDQTEGERATFFTLVVTGASPQREGEREIHTDK